MRKRLDKVLLARGLVPSRSRARDLILRGQVRVEGAVVTEPVCAHLRRRRWLRCRKPRITSRAAR